MSQSFAKKIKILLIEREITHIELAAKLGISSQNLSNKYRRDNFSEKEMLEIVKALDCTLEVTVTLPDGRKI